MQPLPFIPNQVYRRKTEINGQYGGNPQSGVSVSAQYPYIFIFTGKSGNQHGYQDGWDNDNVFSYTGEGQLGDMEFVRGNLALREHLVKGKRVFLFESDGRGEARFICEVEVFDVDYFETPDRSGVLRRGIKFFFKRVGAQIPIGATGQSPTVVEDEGALYESSLPPNRTERQGLVTSRVGQGAYRKRILHRWEYKCAVTGFDKLNVLIASHIVPWADSDSNERLDVHNGILLSPTYDALFDRHLITFENSGRIVLSDAIEHQAYLKIGVTGLEQIKNLGSDNCSYLERHRDRFHGISTVTTN